jgi:protein-disulfide isomerase
LAGALGVSAFFIGSLYTKVRTLEKKPSTATKTEQGETAGAQVGNNKPPVETADKVPPVSKEDHIKGERNARIALIEYSDLECPFCKRFHPTAQKAVDEYAGKVMWVYRHFPLGFHANAQKEAEASECAGELGGNDAFWSYIDLIYKRTTSNGTGFALDALVPLAQELGLDKNKFKECLDSDKFAQNIKDEMSGGSAAGVSGTPGNILLDTKTGKTRLIPGAVPFEQVKQVIDEMLKVN